MLALTPAIYLAEGFTTGDGEIRPELTTLYPTAACTQFVAGLLAPMELSLTFEAIRQILPQETGTAAERIAAAEGEALAVVARAIRQPNNEVLATWLHACTQAVRSEADLVAFLRHALVTERQYGVIAGMSQQGSEPPPSSSQAA
jgi:hypothetical protein